MKLQNGLEINIAPATESDAAAIINYLNQIGGESDNLLFGLNGITMSVKEEEAFIANLQISPTSTMLLGKIDNLIVSVATLTASSRERIAHHGEIALSVMQAYWHLGIGTLMMQALIDFAKGTGVLEILSLGVRKENERALKLYQRLGFEPIGTFPRFFKIGGAYSDEILMNLTL